MDPVSRATGRTHGQMDGLVGGAGHPWASSPLARHAACFPHRRLAQAVTHPAGAWSSPFIWLRVTGAHITSYEPDGRAGRLSFSRWR